MTGAGQSAFSHELYTALEYVQKYGTAKDRKVLYQRHNMPKNFYFMLEEMGCVTGSEGEAEIWHLEDDWITDNITVGSIITASTGANTPVKFALSPTNMYVQNGIQLSYPQVRQKIRIPLTGEIATIVDKDISVNPHQITVEPDDPTVNLAGKIVATGTYAIFTNAWAEGTDGAKSVVSLENRVSNYFQIFKKKFTVTGTALTLQAPFEVMDVKDTNGADKNVFVLRNSSDTDKRHRGEISGALLVGKKSNTDTQFSPELGHNVPAYTTEGLWEAAVTKGHVYPHGGNFDLDDHDAVANILEGERIASDTFMFFQGYGLAGLAENALYQLGVANAGIFSYASTKFKPQVLNGHSPEDFFAWIGFSGVKKRQKLFLYGTLDDFNDPKGLGSPGYEFPNCGIITPWATMDNKKKRASSTSIGAQYRSLGGYSRKNEMFHTGSANMVNPTTDRDIKSFDWRSEIGGDWALMNQTIAVKP